MKKNYLIIGLILLGFIFTATAVDVKIQVDLNSASDFYPDGGVWIMMDNNWTEYWDMTDADGDGIFEYTVTKDAGTDVYYKFSYQNGADPDNDYVVETVPDDCATIDGLRMTVVPDANETLPAVVYESCYTAGITMRVDLSERDDVYEGGAVWVYMDDNWEEYYDMIHDGGGIYYYSLQMDTRQELQYSFSYQNGADPDNDYVVEWVPSECSNDNGYRYLPLPSGDTTLPAFLFDKCTEATEEEVPTYLTTFRVDMQDPVIIDLYAGGGVWLNINNWTDSYDLTDEDGDKIYSVEVEQDSGTKILYKISYQYGPNPDSDYIDEAVPEECASSQSSWDREYIATKDSILPAILVGSCGEFGDPGTEKFDVVYNVELGGDSVVENSMWMVTKNPWSWREQMASVGDVYSSSMKLFKDQTIPYTYVYGGQDNWSGEESVPPACNFGTESAPERLFEGTSADTIIPVVQFGGCIGDPDDVQITYQVDMNGEDMADGDIVWLYIEEGDQWPVMSDDDENGIYSVTLSQMPGVEVFYYYSYGTNDIYDEEEVPSECSNEDGYRKYTVADADHVLPSVIYGTCGYTSIPEFGETFAIYPNPANNFLTIDLGNLNIDTQISISDITGRLVQQLESTRSSKIVIPVNELNQGLYFIQVKSGNDTFSKKILISN